MDDLDSLGWAEAGKLTDEAQAWLDLYGEDPGDMPTGESGAEAAESYDLLADDEREAWVQRQLADAPDLTPEQRARAARLLANDPSEAAVRQVEALGDDR
jgi:hypothetical protein